MAKPLKINWSKVINNLDVTFPEVGLAAPESEDISGELKPDTVGNVTRITMDIFVFDSDDLEQAYMFENNDMKIYQDITLEQTLQLIKDSKRKKA